MATYLGSHALFLAVAIATHAALGAALAAAAFDRPVVGAVGGTVADLDLLFPAALGYPLVHRGITHTALAAGGAAAIAWTVTRDRPVAGALATGYCSHLVVDATTPAGVPVAYPASAGSVGAPLGGHSPAGTLVLWIVALAVLWVGRRTGRRGQSPSAEEREPSEGE